MEQADHPSYTLDARRARKETAARRERQSPDWRSEFSYLRFQSQLTRCHVSSPIGPIQHSILDGLAQVPRLDVRSAIQVRAESPGRAIAFPSSFSPSAGIAQCLRIIFGIICACA